MPRRLRVVRGNGSGEPPRWMALVLYAAGAYNLAWGAFVGLAPLALFRWARMAPPSYPTLWQCIGVMVGLYGVGYLLAARAPLAHWPVVLVGLLGKLLGPLGFASAAVRGELPWTFGVVLLPGAVIWWVPFALILARAYRDRGAHLRLARDHRSLRRA